MFWFLFFTTMYWFVVYKLQTNAFVLMPSVDDWEHSYRIFYFIFGFILGCKLVVMVMKIIEQGRIDIFFIDWERLKMHQSSGNHGNGVTVWRSVFVANEFNELQMEMRYISPETTLIFFGFFIRGLGWEYAA